MKVLEFSPSVDTGHLDRDIVLFFHGFPSIRSQQNRELAERVSQINSVSAFAPLYPGLGITEGQFLFSECLNEVRQWVLALTREQADLGWRGKLKFVGHSWGGFLSLVMANEPLIAPILQKIVLMSPLVYFAPLSDSTAAFETVQKNNPLLSLGSIKNLALDFAEVAKLHPVSQLVRSLSPNLAVTYWQARIDATTPPEMALQIRPIFPCRLNFEIVDQDHSFLQERVSLAERLAHSLNN